MSDDKALYPIREELIAEYVAQQRTDLLLSLFNWMKNSRDRAESTCAIYQARIRQLEEREQTPNGLFVKTEARSPRQNDGVTRDGVTPNRTAPKPVEKAKPAPALDLALDL